VSTTQRSHIKTALVLVIAAIKQLEAEIRRAEDMRRQPLPNLRNVSKINLKPT
jgi:hypothetical protein